MTKVRAPAHAEEVTIRAVVTRADGRVEDHGIVSYYHRRWYWRAWWKLKQTFKGKLHG